MHWKSKDVCEMNGRRYFLDTNAIVQLLAGNKQLAALLSDAIFIATSVICELEFLAFRGLERGDEMLFRRFVRKIEVLDIRGRDEELKARIVELRRHRKLKLPDAIVAASAAMSECTLVTADTRLLDLPGIETLGYVVDNFRKDS